LLHNFWKSPDSAKLLKINNLIKIKPCFNWEQRRLFVYFGSVVVVGPFHLRIYSLAFLYWILIEQRYSLSVKLSYNTTWLAIDYRVFTGNFRVLVALTQIVLGRYEHAMHTKAGAFNRSLTRDPISTFQNTCSYDFSVTIELII